MLGTRRKVKLLIMSALEYQFRLLAMQIAPFRVTCTLPTCVRYSNPGGQPGIPGLGTAYMFIPSTGS